MGCVLRGVAVAAAGLVLALVASAAPPPAPPPPRLVPVPQAVNPAIAPTAVTAVPNRNLRGVAALGRPMARALVTVRCTTQAAFSLQAADDGSFAAYVPPARFPCALRAQGVGSQAGAVYHSFALAPGTANITPLTDAVLALLADDRPAALFDTLSDAQLRVPTQALLDAALAQLKTLLPAPIVLPAGRDPFTTVLRADGVDAMDRVLDSIGALLRARGLVWNDALDYLLAGEAVGSEGPVFVSLVPVLAGAGEVVSIHGRNFPVQPVPAVRLVGPDGRTHTASTLPGNSSSRLSFTVPAGLPSGYYEVNAGGFVLPIRLWLSGTPTPVSYHPYAKAGPVHRTIFTNLMSMDDGTATRGGILFTYPGRVRKAEPCFVRINSGEAVSVSELDAQGRELRRYEWEDLRNTFPAPGVYATLYGSNARGGPDSGQKVQLVPGGGALPAPAFLFGRGTVSSPYHLCVSTNVENLATFQFFNGPALTNWAKVAGVYQGVGRSVWEKTLVVYPGSTFTYVDPQQKSLPFYIRRLNVTIAPDTTCSTTVSDAGKVTVTLSSPTVQGRLLGPFQYSDDFVYQPPLQVADIDTAYFLLPPLIPAANNYRLLDGHPFSGLNDPKMVLDVGWPAYPYHRDRVTIYYGVSKYGWQPGLFDYEGAITCQMGMSLYEAPRYPTQSRTNIVF